MGNATEGLVCVQYRLIAAIFVFLYYVYNVIAGLVYGDTTPKKLPRTENDIFKKSATQLAREIRQRKITSTTVVSAFIERQKQVNPIINAIVADRYDDALLEANEVDKFLAETTKTEDEIANDKPLLGVPVTIKESCSVKGLNLVVGARERIGIKAEENGAAVQKLVNAGAIPLCVTTTPEFCLSTETNNLVTGKTNNPYNVNYASGGSSGGEGAIISSAGSVIGIGSDLAGSIRIPAAFCGIFGHKPSTGLVDLVGHVPYSEEVIFQKMLTIGPLCRYAEDLLLMTKILTENNSLLQLDDPVKLSNLKMYYMVDGGSCFGSMGVHKKIKQRIRDAVDHFRKTWDCDMSDCKFDEVQYTNEANLTFMLSFDDKQYNPNLSILFQLLKTIFGKADISAARLFYLCVKNDKFIMPNDVEKMKHFVDFLADKINKELGDNGVFFYPVFPSSAFRHGMSVFTSSSMSYLSLANITGLPATTIPVGFIENGLPIGIQVMAGKNQDRLCLSVAKELETVFGGWMSPY